MINNEKELSVKENKKNSHKNLKSIASNLKNLINEFFISRKFQKNNPYQTKQINSKNSFYVVEKKHYFNNEYAKRNIAIVASTAFLILLGIYILFFSIEAKNTASNNSYKKAKNTTNSQSDNFSSKNIVEG
jgi:cytochrome oxidase Cu insertion factor (SCO1/SenC/PrrC family)